MPRRETPENPEPQKRPRLTPNQVAAIPILYAQIGNKSEVARRLGIDESTVRDHLEKLSTEEWERIQDMQVKEIVRGSVEIILACLGRINDPKAIQSMTVHQVIGAYKIMADQIRAFGLGEKPKSGAEGDELAAMLAEADLKRRQRAIEEALRTGSLEPLRAFAPAEASCAPVSE